jgi:hypothetical protein
MSGGFRLIGNFGQDGVLLGDGGRAKTADGGLLLLESSLITSKPSTVVPYLNLFYGIDNPQPLAKAEGGVLKNTGINFETDGLTGFPRLDDSARDSYGGALGLELLFGLDQQLVLEVATVQRTSDTEFLGNQVAAGIRYQRPISNAWIVRFDAMHGWLDVGEDIFGGRIELRRKF